MIEVGQDTYVSLVDANTYLAKMGYDPLADEALLVRATKAIDRKFGNRFMGVKTLSSQPLYWPRFITDQSSMYQYNAYGDLIQWTSETIPTELKEATAELARFLDAGFDPYEQQEPGVKSKSESISGAVSVSTTYAGVFVERGVEWNTLEVILGPLLGAPRGIASTISMGRGA
jgi:hypothetical protein